MSDFYKRFLAEDPRRLGGQPRREIFLAGFGKHPGWDDHIEDIGLETASLVIAKQVLYIEGIGGQIDAGSWEKLDADKQVDGFKHVFVWQKSGQILIGKMWSSTDGKGRTRYPMIACAHCLGLPLSWVVSTVLPQLDRLQDCCTATKSADEVRSVFQRVLSELRAAISGLPGKLPPFDLSGEEIQQFLARSELGPNQEGLLRILHQMQTQMTAFARGKSTPLEPDQPRPRPQQIRVPLCADAPARAILLWSGFFSAQLSLNTPFLLILPRAGDWLDLIVGKPSGDEFFCLRASPKAVSRASDVPYNLDPEFKTKADQFLAEFQQGERRASQRRPTALIVGTVILLVLVIALLLNHPFVAQQWPSLGTAVKRVRDRIVHLPFFPHHGNEAQPPPRSEEEQN